MKKHLSLSLSPLSSLSLLLWFYDRRLSPLEPTVMPGAYLAPPFDYSSMHSSKSAPFIHLFFRCRPLSSQLSPFSRVSLRSLQAHLVSRSSSSVVAAAMRLLHPRGASHNKRAAVRGIEREGGAK